MPTDVRGLIIPTVISPTNPPPTCTPTASSGSSNFSLYIRREIMFKRTADPIPTKGDYLGDISAPIAVIATKPHIRPWQIVGMETRELTMQSYGPFKLGK